ncbi:MAG TPA: DNA ligase [Kofleriaceae bacterium]
MPATLADGEKAQVKGSSSTYTLSRNGNVYMCSCPAWRNQGAVIDRRSCKHLRAYLGDAVEAARVGAPTPAPTTPAKPRAGGGRAPAVAKDTAPPILLAHKWEVDHDPTGWWMSEKLDGVRAYWDGETFVSRLGNSFLAPSWFTEDLPADTLDGELWVARKKFSKTIGIVRSGDAGQDWRDICFVVFDAPNAKGSFEERSAHAQKVLAKAGAPHARWLDHVPCTGVDHLRAELARVEGLGGEGLMLREPGSAYVVGRSTTLLKVKTFLDAEARVVGHAPGAGKHKGRCGALIVELANGTRFNVGTGLALLVGQAGANVEPRAVGTGLSDKEREAPPQIGALITFRYQELTDDGVPRFPSYVGERIDADQP